MPTHRILLAEDDVTVSGLITNLLNRHGFYVVHAKDGEEALAIINEQSFDILITDIFMPKVEGIELIEAMSALAPQTRILAISSSGRAGFCDFLTLAETVGADYKLKKPFSPIELLSIIQEMLSMPVKSKYSEDNSEPTQEVYYIAEIKENL